MLLNLYLRVNITISCDEMLEQIQEQKRADCLKKKNRQAKNSSKLS